MTRAKLLGALFALPMMIAGATGAQANVIALNIDGSGSISSANFDLQKQGYITALNNLLLTDGTNAIAVYQFSTNVQQVFALTVINSVATKNALIAAINGMTQIGSNTAIGDSITTAATALNGFVGNLGKKIIDVSTDGVNNRGLSPVTAVANAHSTGIIVNCLGVGANADCTFNDAYATNQDFLAGGFNEFKDAVTAKLSAELTGVPEPMTVTLFGAGLVGAAFARRRAKKA